MCEEKSLILLRGLPGAGKSTLATVLAMNADPVYSVDDYFTDSNGNYLFDYRQNHVAYRLCEENTEKALASGKPRVFVDNTFTMEWEMKPYLEMAKKYNYRIFVLTVEKYHGSSNVHGIGHEQLEKMAAKYAVKLL